MNNFKVTFIGDTKPTLFTNVIGFTLNDIGLILQLINGGSRIIPFTSIKYFDIPTIAFGDVAKEAFVKIEDLDAEWKKK